MTAESEATGLVQGMRELIAELIPYAGDTCPPECRYRDECHDESNLDRGGWPLVCVAYGHLIEKAAALGIEVKR